MLYKIIWQSYPSQSYLYSNDEVIYSQEGGQQGNPLCPFLFSLGIRNLMNNCQSEFNLWYLDDRTVAGKPEVVYEDLKRILAASDTIGVKINDDSVSCMRYPAAKTGAKGVLLRSQRKALPR